MSLPSHGHARRGKKAPEYHIWASMRQRCNNPKNKGYADYGARGISVCDRWNDFSAFIADMGPRPPGTRSIEREDNGGNYEPGNCRWATYKEQASNTRRNIIVSVLGETMTLMQAVEKFGGRYGEVLRRIHRGEPAEQALGLLPRTWRPLTEKLTAEQVLQIRCAIGSQEKIAAEFGVSRSNVGLIRARKIWRHVQ